ncbi:MAG: GMC family oxidoreductase [Terriglobia bacterium]
MGNNSTNTVFDAVIVGAGASGGWASKLLTEAGMKVALVECGRPLDDSEFVEHKPRFELKYRDMAPEVVARTRFIQIHSGACDEFNYTWFCNDIEEPYTTPPNMPFYWKGRLRVTGGRTVVWGRQSYRFSDLDFKAASFDGYGVDWPLSYKDLAPYYDRVEDYVGITGMPEGVPELPDGHFMPPMGLTCAETFFRERVAQRFGRHVTLGRSANITRGINGRAPCHYCGPCSRGCITHSYFNASFTTLADALKTGRCTHIPNAMVWKVLTDQASPRARGVLYVDRQTRSVHEVRGKVVILCATALESARILLNSSTREFPNGLANSSGVLGHYLMDHVFGAGVNGELPNFSGKPNINGPHRPDGIYVIRFRNTPNGARSKNFLRGYGYQGGARPNFNLGAYGFGEEYKTAVLDPVTTIGISGFGECLARWENYVEIDPNVSDIFGIPTLHIHMDHGENDLAMAKDIVDSGAEMLEAAGAKNIRTRPVPQPPGSAIHEVGVARMGENPKTSVLNPFQQTHDIQNLFVMDGSGFPSSACQNPTLTIMALCVRSCDHLIQEMKRGDV